MNGSALDFWEINVPLTPDPASHFGQPGLYLYRFQLLRGNRTVTFWFSDPFSRAAGLGTLSAFTIENNPQPFRWNDAGFSVPEVEDMVVYELNVREFNRDFQGVIDQIDYLQGLGVNVLELMPIKEHSLAIPRPHRAERGSGSNEAILQVTIDIEEPDVDEPRPDFQPLDCDLPSVGG